MHDNSNKMKQRISFRSVYGNNNIAISQRLSAAHNAFVRHSNISSDHSSRVSAQT
jgi:hypothetical protein